MKQIKVNGIVAVTAPDTDAYLMAATMVRQLVLQRDDLARRELMEQAAAKIQCGEESEFRTHRVAIRVVDADLRHHVPDCGHALYAAGTCWTEDCPNFYNFTLATVIRGRRTAIPRAAA